MIIINETRNYTEETFESTDVPFEDGSIAHDAVEVKIIVTIILGVSMILALVGNACTCAVIAKERTMRTPTNCYLLNLAITDILTALLVPIEIYMIWDQRFVYGIIGCRIHDMLWDFFSGCGVLTISAFTVERYLVVTKPFLRQKLALKSRVFKIVIAIWVIACSFCIPDMFYIYDLVQKKKTVCFYSYLYDIPGYIKPFIIIELLVFFMIPMTIIFVFYALIAAKIKTTKTEWMASPTSLNQNRDKINRMLAAVAATFFFCWSPFSILRIMMLTPWLKSQRYYNLWRFIICLSAVNAYLSTAINPILYSLMSCKFRQAFKDLLNGRSSLRNSMHSRQYSMSITDHNHLKK